MAAAGRDISDCLSRQLSALQAALEAHTFIAERLNEAPKSSDDSDDSEEQNTTSDEYRSEASAGADRHRLGSGLVTPLVPEVLVRARTAPGSGQAGLQEESNLTTVFRKSVFGAEALGVDETAYMQMRRSLTSPRQRLTEPLLEGKQRRLPGGRPMSPRGGGLFRRHSVFAEKVEEEGPSSQTVHVMLSAEEMKRRVLNSIKEPSAMTESTYYKESGWAQAMARGHSFQTATLAMVVINVGWIAIEIDYNKADVLCEAPLVFQIVDNFFCMFFTAEMFIRWCAFSRKLDALFSTSFMFDLVIAFSLVWDTWIEVALYLWAGVGTGPKYSLIRIFRLFRLGRIARTARVLNVLPELRILAKGMMMAVRSVFSIVCLLFLTVYTFAIVFTQTLAGTHIGAEHFGTVPESMNFLLLQTLCGFDQDFFTQMLEVHWIMYFTYLCFLFLGSLTVMNLLIGVLCEVVSVVAEVEEEETFYREAMHGLGDILNELDLNNDEQITAEEFQGLLDKPDLVRRLSEQGIDVVALVDYAGFIFRDGNEVHRDDLLSMVVQFRGSKPATVKDLVDMRKFVSSELRRVTTEKPTGNLRFQDARPLEALKGRQQA